MRHLSAGLAFAVLLLFGGHARAETYRLSYEAAVLGVVVLGTASYEVTATPTRYAVRANLRTSGAARLFDQTEITAAAAGSVTTNGGINWSRYDLSHAYSRKFRRTRMTRGAGGVEAQVQPAYRTFGDPAATTAQQRGSYDPLTGLFALGRQIGVARECRGSVLIFDGRGHYRLAVAARGPQSTFNGGGYRGPALNCTLRYQPIAGFDAEDRGARIPMAEAVFALPAQPGFAAPLRFTVPTPIGAAQLDLRSYQRS